MTRISPESSSPFSPDPELIEWIREIRRTVHEFPELSNQEHRTRRYIIEKLQEIGVAIQPIEVGTGIIAFIDPSGPGAYKHPAATVALRADMDALPVIEKTGLPFASRNPGVMHACGHDGHIAMLLGAAALLKRTNLPGRVTCLFQPAEENGNGAMNMIEAGALVGTHAIFAGHIDRHFEVGQIAADSGLICAYTDRFEIRINGTGGHAARPHETIDSVVVASLLVMSIQTLVSREINPAYPTVVSVGRIRGGTAHNVIAEETVLDGTIRSTHADIRAQIIAGLERMVKAMGALYGARTHIRFDEGLPPVINDDFAVELARKAATKVVGRSGIISQVHPSLGGEDFAYYLNRVPGCLVRFGAGRRDLANIPAHSPLFDFDEAVLPIGAAFLAEVAFLALANNSKFKGAERDGIKRSPGPLADGK